MSATRLEHQPWMNAPATRAVMRALNAKGEVARFVGGCVRNALLGAPVEDVDIACALVPDETIRLLKDAGLRVIETGLAHGTVTAISAGKPFEITTLRRDVETDGRHAVVAFTDDWAADAARRDFTINALYADETGTIYDHVGGIADIAARKIRFIGTARARIAEDYLRILRFFRFSAWYGAGPLDADGLSAIRVSLDGLKNLSAERVQKEYLRLLAAPDPVPALQAMEACGVRAALLPQAHHVERLARLMKLDIAADSILRLAALIDAPSAPEIAAKLRLSNAQSTQLRLYCAYDTLPTDETAWNRALYVNGADVVAAQAALLFAAGGIDEPGCRALIARADHWVEPLFPLKGADLAARKIPPGPAMGAYLRELEEWWIAQGFKPDKAALEARLDAMVKEGKV